jgi:hypothetical protein
VQGEVLGGFSSVLESRHSSSQSVS